MNTFLDYTDYIDEFIPVSKLNCTWNRIKRSSGLSFESPLSGAIQVKV